MVLPKRRVTARSITCYHCGHAFEVPGRAMSTTCSKCHRAIKVEDVVVKSYVPVHALQTCGCIRVTRRGRVAARDVQCGSRLECEGTIEASIQTEGEVVLGSKATWRGGTLRAKVLTIEDGATLVGRIVVPGSSAPEDDDEREEAARSRTAPGAIASAARAASRAAATPATNGGASDAAKPTRGRGRRGATSARTP